MRFEAFRYRLTTKVAIENRVAEAGIWNAHDQMLLAEMAEAARVLTASVAKYAGVSGASKSVKVSTDAAGGAATTPDTVEEGNEPEVPHGGR